MSLAVLAKKTKAKQRVRTRGNFILNMTGRGNVLGLSAKMSRGNCKGLTNCAGKRAACCAGTPAPQCCTFKHGGKPAPQMGYGIYLNRKSKGAYHPGGGPQCCTKPNATTGKIVYKQPANISASVITTQKRDAVLACNSDVLVGVCGCNVPICQHKDENNNMIVGQGSGIPGSELKTGYNSPPGTQFGSFTPLNIPTSNGSLELSWAEFSANITDPVVFTISLNDLFAIQLPVDNGDAEFTISFVDCETQSYQTFNTRDALYKDNNTNGMGGLTPAGIATVFLWANPAATQLTGLGPALIVPRDSGGNYVPWHSMEAWWEARLGKTLKVFVTPNESGKLPYSLDEICCFCRCPVKKNICGCRATDLVRYTRINHNWYTSTKAVPQNRIASEQIARVRASINCTNPKHKDIYITLTGTGPVGTALSFDGCCGNQCLISGHIYTFHILNMTGSSGTPIQIIWCNGEAGSGGLNEIHNIAVAGTTVFTTKVPNVICNTTPITGAGLQTGQANQVAIFRSAGANTLFLDYCQKAFKKPQMLGSCNGR